MNDQKNDDIKKSESIITNDEIHTGRRNRNDYETGWTSSDRYLLNLIRSKRILEIEKEYFERDYP